MKQFFGYKNKLEALKEWSAEVLDSGLVTTETINVVEDGSAWPQTISHQETITRVELSDFIISY